MHMRFATTCVLFALVCLLFVPSADAQDHVVLRGGERVEGTVRPMYTTDRALDRLSVRGSTYHAREVKGYRLGASFFRVLGRTRTVTRTVSDGNGGTRQTRATAVRFLPLRRYVEGPLDLYSGAPEGIAGPPYDYFAQEGGALYEVSHDNLRRVMDEGMPSRDTLDASAKWRYARNGAAIGGIGLMAWGIVRGSEIPGTPGAQFRLELPLVVGAVSVVSSYVFHRKARAAFWNSIQTYNRRMTSSTQPYRYPSPPPVHTR